MEMEKANTFICEYEYEYECINSYLSFIYEYEYELDR